MKKERWFITGGAGFIGSNLAEFLLQRDCDVVILDDLSTGNAANIERCKSVGPGTLVFIHDDILNISKYDYFLRNTDALVHLAAQVSVPKSIAEPIDTHRLNSTGFIHVLTEACASGIEFIAYASSCSVYGNTDRIPTTEDCPIDPLSLYAATKASNELYAKAISRFHVHSRIIGLRFFNIYGPWQDSASPYASVIPKWVDCMSHGSNPIIYGDGNQTRDFCFVEDLCSVLLKLKRSYSRITGRVFNVCTGNSHSLNTLYSTLAVRWSEFSGSQYVPPVCYYDSRPGDVYASCGSPNQLSDAIGFTQPTPLTVGIDKILRAEFKDYAN